MTVSSQVNKTIHSPDGVQTVFAYNFLVQNAGTLFAILEEPGQPEQDITSTIQSITGIGSQSGGTVTFSEAPAVGTLTLIRQISLTQDTTYKTFGRFPAKVNESDHDKGMMVSQQLDEAIRRAIKQSVSVTDSDLTFPPYQSAGLIGWDVGTQQLINWVAAEIPLATLTPWGLGLVQQPDSKAGRDYLVAPRLTRQATDPGLTDDENAGYQVGDYVWSDATQRIFNARSVAAGAAQWFRLLNEDDAAGGGGGNPLPVGTIIVYTGDIGSMPDDFLLAEGGTFVGANYPELRDSYQAAGFPHGGDATNPGLPDYRDLLVAGASATNAQGTLSGQVGDQVTLVEANLPSSVSIIKAGTDTNVQAGSSGTNFVPLGSDVPVNIKNRRAHAYYVVVARSVAALGGGDVLRDGVGQSGYWAVWTNWATKKLGAIQALLGNLADVDMTTTPPVEDDVPAWDNTNSKWVPRARGSGGGPTVHNDLTGRSATDAHPQSAITGLVAALAAKAALAGATFTGTVNVSTGELQEGGDRVYSPNNPPPATGGDMVAPGGMSIGELYAAGNVAGTATSTTGVIVSNVITNNVNNQSIGGGVAATKFGVRGSTSARVVVRDDGHTLNQEGFALRVDNGIFYLDSTDNLDAALTENIRAYHGGGVTVGGLVSNPGLGVLAANTDLRVGAESVFRPSVGRTFPAVENKVTPTVITTATPSVAGQNNYFHLAPASASTSITITLPDKTTDNVTKTILISPNVNIVTFDAARLPDKTLGADKPNTERWLTVVVLNGRLTVGWSVEA